MSSSGVKYLRVVLCDQLSLATPSIRSFERSSDTLFMAEVLEEATYVRHHKKKLALVLSAMRHFAADREADMDGGLYSPRRLRHPQHADL